MLRMFSTSRSACASLCLFTGSAKPLIPLTDPLTPQACNTIRNALQSSLSRPKNIYNQLGANAAVLIPLCNVNGKSGILLQVRGKLRTHPGEVRYVVEPMKTHHPKIDRDRCDPVSLAVESMRFV